MDEQLEKIYIRFSLHFNGLFLVRELTIYVYNTVFIAYLKSNEKFIRPLTREKSLKMHCFKRGKCLLRIENRK